MSKKDSVPEYKSDVEEGSGPSRGDIMDRYGFGSQESDAEREMREWEEAQAAKLAQQDEARRTRPLARTTPDTRPPVAVELALLAHNPFNPRDELTDIEETAQSLLVRGQIQPVTVARRDAFLNAHPLQEAALGAAEYVVIDGNRRLAAAHEAGLLKLRIDVNDELATSAADILESALIANIHRVDVPPLDQAKAIQELVAVHGSQGRVARRLGKTPAWVSQRLALLELPKDLQEKVESGELKVKDGRRIGRLPEEQQRPEAEAAIARTQAPRPPRASKEAPEPQPTVNPVNGSEAVSATASATGPGINPVNTVAVPGQQSGEVSDPLGAAATGTLDTLLVQLEPFDPTATARAFRGGLEAQQLKRFVSALLGHEVSPEEVVEMLAWHLAPNDRVRVGQSLLAWSPAGSVTE